MINFMETVIGLNNSKHETNNIYAETELCLASASDIAERMYVAFKESGTDKNWIEKIIVYIRSLIDRMITFVSGIFKKPKGKVLPFGTQILMDKSWLNTPGCDTCIKDLEELLEKHDDHDLRELIEGIKHTIKHKTRGIKRRSGLEYEDDMTVLDVFRLINTLKAAVVSNLNEHVNFKSIPDSIDVVFGRLTIFKDDSMANGFNGVMTILKELNDQLEHKGDIDKIVKMISDTFVGDVFMSDNAIKVDNMTPRIVYNTDKNIIHNFTEDSGIEFHVFIDSAVGIVITKIENTLKKLVNN